MSFRVLVKVNPRKLASDVLAFILAATMAGFIDYLIMLYFT